MTSKYASAVYEMVQARANLDRCVETIQGGLSVRHHYTQLTRFSPAFENRAEVRDFIPFVRRTTELSIASDQGARLKHSSEYLAMAKIMFAAAILVGILNAISAPVVIDAPPGRPDPLVGVDARATAKPDRLGVDAIDA